MKKPWALLFIILLLSVVSGCSYKSANLENGKSEEGALQPSNLQFDHFNSFQDGNHTTISMDITNTESRTIEGSFYVNLLDDSGKVVRKVYFQFPDGGIKPNETVEFSKEIANVKFTKWNMGYVQLKDSRTEPLQPFYQFLFILGIPVLIQLIRKMTNKMLGVEEKRISETPGYKVGRRGVVVLFITFLCFLPFFVDGHFTLLVYSYLLASGIYQVYLERRYLKNSKQYISSLIYLVIIVIIMFSIHYFYGL